MAIKTRSRTHLILSGRSYRDFNCEQSNKIFSSALWWSCNNILYLFNLSLSVRPSVRPSPEARSFVLAFDDCGVCNRISD